MPWPKVSPPAQPAMAGVEGALKCLQAFVVDQWKTGGAAELRLFCESGRLKASVSADFGPSCLSWRANSAFMGGNASGSPSRQRRRERRAAARAAAEKTGTEKVAKEKVADEKTAAEEVAAAEKCAALKTAAEKCAALKAEFDKCDAKKAEEAAAEKIAAEKCAVPKAVTENREAKKDFEKCSALKVETEMCDAKKAAEKCDAKKAAEKCATECSLTSVSTAAVASTSCLGSQPTTVETCWNCEGFLTLDHQCDGPPSPGHMPGAVTLFPPVAVVSSPPRPSPSAPIILKKQ